MRLVLATARTALAALLVLGAVGTARAGDADFLPGLGDVPAMPGLGPAGDGGLVFDKPGGRIAEAVLAGPVARERIRSFYADALPPLGWRPIAADRFGREGEELRLEFLAAPAGGTTVRFLLIPR